MIKQNQHNSHKNIKTKEKNDFNTNHLTDIDHGINVEIYLYSEVF